MVTIVGAGLVGSLWAILLRKQGCEVTIFERRPDPRVKSNDAGRSINLVLTSRGLNGLEKAGLLEKVHKLAVPVYGRMIHTQAGELIYQAYGQADECNWSISRGELNKFLIDEAVKAGVQVHFEHDLNNLDPQSKKIGFKTPQGLKNFNYDILFGADGSHSRVRKQLALVYAQQMNENIEWLEADYKELTLPAGSGLRTDALHIWPRGAHMMMALANLDGSFTMTVYLPKKTDTNKPWSFERVQSKAQIEEFFKSEFKDAIPLMPNYIPEFLEHPQGTLGTVRCSKWVFNDSIALIGDAAHGIVPFFGQGMNSGFEDCTTLLELYQQEPQAWASILKKYESRQKPNTDAIADMALENWVEMRDKVGDSGFLLRKKIEATLEQKHPGIFKSRYGLITYTLVPYALAQKAGHQQSLIIDQLTQGVSSLDQVSWPRAEDLLQKEWLPFVKANRLEIKNYEPKNS